MRVNAWQEIQEELSSRGLPSSAIHWIGTQDGSRVLTVDRWREVLSSLTYALRPFTDNSLLHTLVVVGDGWWLERGAIYGMEGWLFRKQPKLQATVDPLNLNDIYVNK